VQIVTATFLVAILSIGSLGYVALEGNSPAALTRPLLGIHPLPISSQLAVGADYATYLGNPQRTANVTGELSINVTSAADKATKIHVLWNSNTNSLQSQKGSSIAPQPIDVNGVVYVGSWDGYEYAFNASGVNGKGFQSTGALLWKTYLGIGGKLNGTLGDGGEFGITSTTAYSNGILYVADNNVTAQSDYLYALNATTGQILWAYSMGQLWCNYYTWSSPLVSDGSVYIGVDSDFDNFQVPSGVDQINITNLMGQPPPAGSGVFFNSSLGNGNNEKFIPPGCTTVALNSDTGVGVWSSPSFAPNPGGTPTVFISTGNQHNTTAKDEASAIYAESIIEMNATAICVPDPSNKGICYPPLAKFSIPSTERISDGDFGTTPTVIALHDGPTLVVAANKNGYLYILNASNGLSTQKAVDLAVKGISSVNAAVPPISSAAWDGNLVYAAEPLNNSANKLLLNVSARNPITGQAVWEEWLTNATPSGNQYAGPVVVDNPIRGQSNLLLVTDDNLLLFLNASNGKIVYQYDAANTIIGPPSVSRGEILVGLMGGHLIALDLTFTARESQKKVPHTPSTYSFDVIGQGGLPNGTLGQYNFTWLIKGATNPFSYTESPTYCFATPGKYVVDADVRDLSNHYVNRTLTLTVSSTASCPPIKLTGTTSPIVISPDQTQTSIASVSAVTRFPSPERSRA
jgi:outer membrane protein assembly factor BamB